MELCYFCDYSPCMCGRKDYVTENERRQRERADADARMKDEDAWDYPEQESHFSDESVFIPDGVARG